MSKNKNIQKNFILNKINELKFELEERNVYFIIPSYSIQVNDNTFAFVCYHYKVKFTETIIDFIKFYSYINNNFI